MGVTFVSEIESQPVEVREKQPVPKRMPKVSSWRCSKCGLKGHVKSACKGKGRASVAVALTKLKERGADIASVRGLDTLITRMDEEIGDQEKQVKTLEASVSELHDAEADLRALRRLRARLGTA